MESDEYSIESEFCLFRCRIPSVAAATLFYAADQHFPVWCDVEIAEAADSGLPSRLSLTTSLPSNVRSYCHETPRVGVLWPACMALIRHMIHTESSGSGDRVLWPRRRIAELGAGAGLVSLVLTHVCMSLHMSTHMSTHKCRSSSHVYTHVDTHVYTDIARPRQAVCRLFRSCDGLPSHRHRASKAQLSNLCASKPHRQRL